MDDPTMMKVQTTNSDAKSVNLKFLDDDCSCCEAFVLVDDEALEDDGRRTAMMILED